MSLTVLLFLVALLQTTSSQVFVRADDCSLYLAKSSIPEAGMGVFAARDFRRGDPIGPAGLGIALTDYPTKLPKYAADTPAFLYEYLWDASVLGGENEARVVDLFLPGMLSMMNYHSHLANVFPGGLKRDVLTKDDYEEWDQKEKLPSTYQPSTGSGSYTTYHDFQLYASRDIAAGEELFVDQEMQKGPEGDINNPRRRPRQRWWSRDELPAARHYIRADEIVAGLDDSTLDLTEAQWVDVLYRITSEIFGPIEKTKRKNENEVNATDAVDINVIISLLPKSYDEFLFAKEHGTAKLQLEERDVEWIRKNGYCLDNIEEQTSSIPEAGRGAFATRMIPKGSVIAPAPLVHLLDERLLEVPKRVSAADGDNSTQQLLTNYCFGHDSSSLKLCPLSSVALINHHSNAANAELQWSDNVADEDDDIDYLTMTTDNLKVSEGGKMERFKTRLMLNCVASRDIYPGEEIFLDYGTEWQQAYRDHVLDQMTKQGTISSSDSTTDDANLRSLPLPANVLNKKVRNIPLTTHSGDVVGIDGYDTSSYQFECQLYPNLQDYSQGGKVEVPTEDFRHSNEIDSTFWPEDQRLMYSASKNNHVSWYPCKVVSVNKKDDMLYDVEVYERSTVLDFEPRVIRRFTDCPRGRIRLADGAYQSEQFLHAAFRHHIPLPDSLFPFTWRDDNSVGDADDVEAMLEKVKCSLYSC